MGGFSFPQNKEAFRLSFTSEKCVIILRMSVYSCVSMLTTTRKITIAVAPHLQYTVKLPQTTQRTLKFYILRRKVGETIVLRQREYMDVCNALVQHEIPCVSAERSRYLGLVCWAGLSVLVWSTARILTVGILRAVGSSNVNPYILWREALGPRCMQTGNEYQKGRNNHIILSSCRVRGSSVGSRVCVEVSLGDYWQLLYWTTAKNIKRAVV